MRLLGWNLKFIANYKAEPFDDKMEYLNFLLLKLRF